MKVKFKPRHLTMGLSLALLLKTSRGFSQEDWGGYRHEFYREEDNRMSVDTDSASFDIGLGSHVRLQADFVIDAISGASPSGAPPQSKWTFPTFTSYYNTAYNNFLQTAINDPANLILLQAGIIPTYQLYTNYVATNNPQFGTQATNIATSQIQTLTNNPNFHNSTRVPLVPVHDLRRAFTFNLPVTFGFSQITPQVSVSKESDYHSYGVALNYAAQLNKKNTTINAGWSHTVDRVRDDVEVWQGKVSDDILIGFTQLLTPKSYVTVDFTYAQEYGYLSDPYRAVLTLDTLQNNPDDPALTPENRPRRRTKEIFYTSYNQFFEPLDGSVELGYRFFHDSYGIYAHTVELAWHQKLGRHVVFTPAFRYYNQTAASFYAIEFEDSQNLPPYYSSDYRLSELQAITASGTLTYRLQKHFSLDLSYTRYIMQGLDGATSQSAYPVANVYSAGARFWF